MKIAIGCDHGGFELKEAVRGYLEERQIPYEDFGAYNTDSVDYAPIAAKAARAYMHRAGLELLRQARVEFCGKALTLQVRDQGAPGPLRTCQQADGVLFFRQGAQLLRQLGHGAAPYPQGLQPEVGQMPHRGVKAAPRHGVQIQRFLFCINFRQRVKINRIPV